MPMPGRWWHPTVPCSATRTLLHPHVDEQPFTRSLTGITIPEGTDEVVVRAHDSVHGNGGAELRVQVPR